jgi:hypothetical protein
MLTYFSNTCSFCFLLILTLQLIFRFISFIKPFKIYLYIFVVFPSEAYSDLRIVLVLKYWWDHGHCLSFYMFLETGGGVKTFLYYNSTKYKFQYMHKHDFSMNTWSKPQEKGSVFWKHFNNDLSEPCVHIMNALKTTCIYMHQQYHDWYSKVWNKSLN